MVVLAGRNDRQVLFRRESLVRFFYFVFSMPLS
jgi:hypothetical protein